MQGYIKFAADKVFNELKSVYQYGYQKVNSYCVLSSFAEYVFMKIKSTVSIPLSSLTSVGLIVLIFGGHRRCSIG